MGEPRLICFGSGFRFEIGLLLKGKDWFFFSFLLSSGAGTLPSLERNSMTEDGLQAAGPLLLQVSASLSCGSLSSGDRGVGPRHRPWALLLPLFCLPATPSTAALPTGSAFTRLLAPLGLLASDCGASRLRSLGLGRQLMVVVG